MSFKVVTAVTTEPVLLAEAKLQLRLDDIGGSHPDDALVTALITVAREFAEHYTGRALAEQTLEMALDYFPVYENDHIDLPRPPVASITSIKYTDASGVEQTVAGSAYSLSAYGESRRVIPAFNTYWPITQRIPDAVRIRYVTGYGATGAAAGFTVCPKAAKAAILLHIQLEYVGNNMAPQERESMERARDSLLNTLKIWGH